MEDGVKGKETESKETICRTSETVQAIEHAHGKGELDSQSRSGAN